jgi:hypothetical protein
MPNRANKPILKRQLRFARTAPVPSSLLRESSGYLDEGFRQTARLVTHAADEIERLTNRVRELETGATATREPGTTRRPSRLSRIGARIAVVSRRSQT